MIEEARGRIDYEESGRGPTIVFVPGSCSTGAAWKGVIGQWKGHFRCVTTSLLGYGGTEERRTEADPSFMYEAEVVESVVRRAGGPVHLVGHSFGAGAALITAMRKQVPLASLTLIEMPAVMMLQPAGEFAHYSAFRQMTNAYFAAYRGGDKEAIRMMIDFYGGEGTFDSWPPRLRDYAVETTPVNMLDWASAYAFWQLPNRIREVEAPTLVMWGGLSHPAVQRANELVTEGIRGASPTVVGGAAHFMIGTHPEEVANRISRHVLRTEGKLRPMAYDIAAE